VFAAFILFVGSIASQEWLPLQKIVTNLPGVFELRPTVHRDSRGFFLETYHCAKLAALGIHEHFVQDNHSASRRNTLRGLHYQLRHPQAKLCRVIEGQVLDVAVDIRVGSRNVGRCTAVLLSAETQNQIYIPAGFAHGFLALTETVQFLYKCSDFYHHSDERGILWSDPLLGIKWGVAADALIISEKDAGLPTIAELTPDLLPKYVPPLKPMERTSWHAE
jgi:dTDP-4-dehydrorhamnose 3,5-epimerase